MLPNFIIGGGVASGTSFLSAALAHHPEIYLPREQRPEPNFFHYSAKHDKGADWYQATWFAGVNGHKVVIDRSSLYLTSGVAARRMKKLLSDVKLIFCLRNPIERAYANYRFSVLEGLEPLSFDEAIETEPARMRAAVGRWAEVQPHAYLTRSRYASHLDEYFRLFGRRNVLLLKSEDLGRKPHEHIRRVLEFMGVNPDVELPLPPNYSSPTVLDRILQTQLRSRIGGRFSEIIEHIRKEESLDGIAGSDASERDIEELRGNLGTGKEPLPAHSRHRLRELLADDIARTAALVDFPTEDWI